MLASPTPQRRGWLLAAAAAAQRAAERRPAADRAAAGELAPRPAAVEPEDRAQPPAAAAEQPQADRALAQASERRFKPSWAATRPTRSEARSGTPSSTLAAAARRPAFQAWACRWASAVRAQRRPAKSQSRRLEPPDPA